MLYLSQILGRPVRDAEGEAVATIRDVVVRLGEDHPPVTGLVARFRRRDFYLPRPNLAAFGAAGASLNTDVLDLRPFTRRGGEALLARDVLDKQLIDVDGKRVVRVNDVQLIDAGGEWRVTGADVSLQGLWRRLIPSGLISSNPKPVEVLDWADVGYLATDAATVQLKSSRDKLSRLHPVEIARLTEALSYQQGAEMLASLDDETAAETLEELHEQHQARIIGDMDEERAADILEHMSPDEAADVLGDLPEAVAEDLLSRMEGEEQAEVAELLPYEDDTAGGLMTTEFLTVPKNLTVGEALARLREMAETPNMIYYLYVVEEEGSWKLSGVIALRSLILSDPTFRLEDVMREEFQHAHPDDSARAVAERIAEYNLLALPVVDDLGEIAGIVTVDDAMEWLLPKGWRKRLPRLFG
jgi:CBS domain-containing protein